MSHHHPSPDDEFWEEEPGLGIHMCNTIRVNQEVKWSGAGTCRFEGCLGCLECSVGCGRWGTMQGTTSPSGIMHAHTHITGMLYTMDERGEFRGSLNEQFR